MSLYSNSKINTHIVRPIYHNKQRTEFRLPAKNLLSNWRLVNVGCSVDATAVGNNVKYPVNSGCHCLFENIYLYANDNQLIASLRNAHQYLAVVDALQNNAEETSLTHYLTQNGMGFTVGVDGKIKMSADSPVLTGDVTTTPKGRLDLTTALKYLDYTKVVPCDVLDLRLVIEWSQSGTNFNMDPTGPAVTITAIAEPELIVDEIDGASPQSGSVQYWNVENDRAVIDAVPAGADPKETEFKLDGYDGKVVNRVLMLNNINSIPEQKTGIDRSVPQVGEEVDILLNGKQVIPFGGINSASKKQHLFNSTWGSMNFPLGCNMEGMDGVVDIYTDANIPAFSYGGMSWADAGRITDCQIKYKRFHGAIPAQQNSMNYIVFAEVGRAMEYKDSKVVVANA